MLDRDRSALLVIDFQEKLLPKIEHHEVIVNNSIKLIEFCKGLNIPILWTEQYPKGIGPTVESVRTALDGAQAIEKTEFGCLANSDFMGALSGSGKKQLVVTGIEAHICVMQTVLSAVDEDYDVFVVQDAVGSRRADDREAGLHRMEKAGAEIVTTEMTMFEVLRKAGTPEFKQALPLFK